MKRYVSAGAVAIGGLASLFACSENEKDLVKPKSIMEVVSSNSDFSTLRSIIVYSGMSDSLSGGTFTMFAPSNSAFEKINVRDASTISALPKDSVKRFLKYHLLSKKMSYSQFTAGELMNISKDKLVITKDEEDMLINKNHVVIPDINASNGLIQVIDSVLVKLK